MMNGPIYYDPFVSTLHPVVLWQDSIIKIYVLEAILMFLSRLDLKPRGEKESEAIAGLGG
jgi:hypothetical protein